MAIVKNDKGIPTPTIREASLGFSSWVIAIIDPVIIGAIAASMTDT